MDDVFGWIEQRFGPGSPEDLAWNLGQATHLPRTARLLVAYNDLKKVYDGKGTRDQKLAEKAKIIDDMREVTILRDGKPVVVKAHVGWPQELIDLIGSIDEEIPRFPQQPITELKDPFE